jgi:hypothetical protein
VPLITYKRNRHGYRVGSDPSRAVGFVYALWDGSAIKVGSSKEHPRSRLSTLQTGNPRYLRLVAYRLVEDGKSPSEVERQTHRRLWHSHLRGEWFRVTPRVMAELNEWDWIDSYFIDMLRRGCHPGPA